VAEVIELFAGRDLPDHEAVGDTVSLLHSAFVLDAAVTARTDGSNPQPAAARTRYDSIEEPMDE
jgi:hypothetical protein